MPPKSAPAKRGSAAQPAAADGAAADGRRVSHRAHGIPALDYNEQKDAGAHGPVLKAESERQFWDQWDTPLLWTWVADYKRKDVKMTAALKGNREALLNILVEPWVERPAASKEIEQLLLIWVKWTKPHAEDPRPGKFPSLGQELAGSSAAAAAPAASPAPKTPAKSKAKESRKKPRPASDSEPEMEEEEIDEEGPVGHDPHRYKSAVHPTKRMDYSSTMTGWMACPHCSCKNSGESDLGFVCCVCDMIASQPLDGPLNQARLAKMVASGPTPSAAAASSSAMSSGQLLTEIFEGSTATQRREKELKEYIKLPANPIFAALPPGALFPHEEALRISRQAFNASAYELPSPALVNVIRAGVLLKPGFAKPRLISEAMERGPSITIGGAGAINTPATAIPRLESADEFCMAMFSTILPALIDRPKALAEWLALGRTALELASTKRWETAANYIDQLLMERTYAREPYATVSVPVMTTVVFSAHTLPSAQPFGGRGPQQQQVSQQQQQQQQRQQPRFCGDYNFKAGGCTRDGCSFKHECQYGAKGCKETKAHRAIDCPLKPPKPDGPRNPPGSVRSSAPSSGASGSNRG